ncbi:MAG: efflux RND transporter periplasmic adaptor subunit, partial [Pirellulaceae bacterium]
RWILLAGLALGLLMLIPIPYQPKRECRIEPGIRRYIASPIEGRLQSVAVRPGEEVRTGQLLAKLDDMPLVRELAAAEAELQTHHKRRDVALATRAGGDLRIAQLEMQQIQLKIDALKDQLQRLEITSPCDGVLVQGDWFGNDGMPVSFGQNLFEIAPLDKMVAEIHLLAEDLPWVAVGSQAVMRTDTSLHRAWTGTIDRIEPRAEVVDEEAVFIGEMEIENQEHLFRPGMKARVAVDTGMKSIGWILVRKPYRWLQNQWIW